MRCMQKPSVGADCTILWWYSACVADALAVLPVVQLGGSTRQNGMAIVAINSAQYLEALEGILQGFARAY